VCVNKLLQREPETGGGGAADTSHFSNMVGHQTGEDVVLDEGSW
jgi:hypothetical protein